MKTSVKRRVLGLAAVVLASQMLSACIVLPVGGYRARPIVVEPGYGPPPAHGPYWRR